MKDIVFNEKPETWSHVSGMKIMMFVTLTLPLILSAGEVRWQKGSNGQWNGDWSDTSHWSTGTLPAQSDCVIFPEVAEGVTITVSNTYSIANMYMMPMAGPAGHRYDFTLVGSGQVNLVGADSSGYASWITEGRSLTLDGVSLVDAGYQDLMVRGRITVKNGALLRNTRIAKMLLRDAEYIVDGGRFEFSEMAYEASADAWSGAPWPMRFILKSGSVSGRYFYGGTQPLSVEVCNGTMEFSELFTLNNAGCELKIAGGSVKALNSFAIAAGASLVLIDGMLQFPSVAAIDAAANLSLTGGILTLGVVTEDPRFNREGDVTLKYDLGTGVYVKSGSVPVVADTIRLQRFETDSDASSVLHGKFRNIIFSATSEPFRFGNGNQRCFYLEGPTAIWSESDQIDTLGSTWYTYLEGDFIVNTCDARDSTIKRHLSLWSSASRFGSASLTVRGGGSLCLLQHGSASTFRFVTVGTGTTLNLANRRAGEWGPTSAERFTLGAQAKVTMEAKYNHIVADVFSIDPTATIEVQVDDGLTCGAFAILQSSKGVTPDATIVDQIVLKGHAEGWSL